MLEILEWASVGNRWLPILIVIGIICLTIVEMLKIIMKHKD